MQPGKDCNVLIVRPNNHVSHDACPETLETFWMSTSDLKLGPWNQEPRCKVAKTSATPFIPFGSVNTELWWTECTNRSQLFWKSSLKGQGLLLAHSVGVQYTMRWGRQGGSSLGQLVSLYLPSGSREWWSLVLSQCFPFYVPVTQA